MCCFLLNLVHVSDIECDESFAGCGKKIVTSLSLSKDHKGHILTRDQLDIYDVSIMLHNMYIKP